MALAERALPKTFPGRDALPDAHQRLLADRDLQFAMPTPRPPPKPPAWAAWIADVLEQLAPVLHYLFWAGLAVLALGVVYLVGRELIHIRLPRKTAKAKPDRAWRPTEQAARALLEDADRLAAEGRFAQASHLLLLRSIEDIEGRRPRAVQPALTARDIAALDALPQAARPSFALIAEVVERSLFGGRGVDADAWRRCRDAYETFALPQGWAA
jgi:hypothetical protein